MKTAKYIALGWLVMTVTVFLLLPVSNLTMNGWPRDAGLKTIKGLFSSDSVEGYINYALWRAGISGDFDKVVIGRQGWFFLGNHYNDVLSKARAMSTVKEQQINRTVSRTVRYQRWMAAQGIASVFVIAPNKHSIYPEFAPPWTVFSGGQETDRFVSLAKRENMNVIDLRPILLGQKNNHVLYYKTDTHWNTVGAALAYKTTLNYLNRRYRHHLQMVDRISFVPTPNLQGDLVSFLKFSKLLDKNHDTFYVPQFDGIQDIITICDLDSETLSKQSNCRQRKNNFELDINRQSVIVSNKAALNNLSVLWLRDSFGDANSVYYHKSFSRIWEIHYAKLRGAGLRRFIRQNRPDLVIYQVIERALF